MPSWEETKRKAQTAFIRQENSVQPLPDSIGTMYQQIVSTGYITSSLSRESLTRQIAEGMMEPQEAQPPEIIRSVEQEKDIEPER